MKLKMKLQRKFKKLVAVTLTLGLLALTGCSGGGGGQPAQKTEPAKQENEAIKVGVIGAFQLTAGKEIKDAAEMAIEEINRAGGINGRQVKGFYADTKAKPEEGKAAVEQLLFKEKVNFVIGEHRSEVALAVQPILMENKTLYINTGSASPLLSKNVLDNYNLNKYTFRTFLNSNQMGDNFLKNLVDLVDKFKIDKIAVLAESAVWTEPIVKAVNEHFGSKVVLVERPATDTKDFSIELSRVEKAQAQLIFTLFSADQGVIFARQWKDRQIPALVTGYTVQAQSPAFWEQTEGKAENYITWKHGVRSPISDKTIPHWDAFKAKYGRAPGPYTEISTYDAFMVLAEAIKRANSIKADELVKVLEENTFMGASGKIKFGKNHDPEVGDDFVPYTFIQWRKGEMVTIWPDKFKTGELIFPKK